MPFKLPAVIPVSKNLRIRIDVLKNYEYPKAVELFEDFKKSGEIGIDEFPDKDSIHRKLKSGTSFSLVDADTEKTLGYYLLYGSPFVRSLRPRCHAQYTALKPEYRGDALGLALYFFLMPFALANGYEGNLARIHMQNPKWISRIQNSTSALPLMIPGGVNLSSGPTNDIVTYLEYDRDFIEITDFPNMSEKEKDYCLSLHNDSWSIVPHCPRMNVEIPERKHTFSCGLETAIKVPTEAEEKEIEKLALEAAKEGHGFGEDEFLPSENYGKRMLHKYFMLIVKTSGGDTVCGAIMGPSVLCRSDNTDKMSGNIVVSNKYRKKKIGGEFMGICLQEIQNLGFNAVLTDILSTDLPRILPLVKRLGFTVIGSLPSCAKVKGQGWTDSIVVYKKLQTSKL